MKKETKKWFEKAKGDLQKAQDNFTIKHYDLASFLCQQAVEKALKALLIERTDEFPRIHDLVRLGRLAIIDKELLAECEKLTYVYTETRYPDTEEREFTEKESKADIESANRILEWIGTKI